MSNGSRCVDVEGFSIYQGGNIFQWEYLGGLNQKWRFIRVDPIPIDTTDIIYPRLIPSATAKDFISGQQEQFRVFPNPGNDGYVMVTLPPDKEIEYRISVYDMTGKLIKDIIIPAGLSIYRLDTHDIDRGIYIIRFRSSRSEVNRMLIIN